MLLSVLLPWIPAVGFHGENLCVSVRFRIVSVDVNFHPVNETVSLLTVDECGENKHKLKAHSFEKHETNMIS